MGSGFGQGEEKRRGWVKGDGDGDVRMVMDACGMRIVTTSYPSYGTTYSHVKGEEEKERH